MLASRDELRVAAVLLAALLGVHQLRYALAFGGDAGTALAQHGHGYLAWATPLVGLLGALAVARLLVRAASATRPADPRAVRLARVWPAASIALLGLYAGQELIEGALSAGHPDWWTGVFGSGGWVAVPLAALFGAVVALTLRLSDVVETRLRRHWSAPRPAAPIALARILRAPAVVAAHRQGVLARHLAGRAPPVHSV